MEPSNWAPEHSDALREFMTKGMSFSEAARAINKKFGTRYTRSAAIGRGKRLGLGAPVVIESPSIVAPLPNGLRPIERRTRPFSFVRPPPTAFERAEPVKLRCVGVRPRLLPLVELEAGDCRYPYGGDKDGEEIAFCGHPSQSGSSYCAAHSSLTRGPGRTRPAGPVILRLVTSI